MRIVLCYPVESRHIERIAAAAPDALIVDAGQERIAEELFGADIYCGHAKVPVDWGGVVKQGRLKWIQSSAAGMDHCLVPAVIGSKIVVTSASGVLADQVAEHTLSLLLAWHRSLPVFLEAQKKHEFIRRPTKDLHRKVIGIVGMGGVGRRFVQLLHPLKTRILATDLFPIDRPKQVEALWGADQLDRLLESSDIVVLSLPLNETTRGMFDAKVFEKMKPDALFVNMARGALVVTTDLVDSLESGHLSGAILDVTDPEPLPNSSRLWDMPGVVITPHVGGQSRWRIDDMTDLLCENLRRWQSDERLINRLTDLRLGFPTRDGETLLWTDYRAR